MAIKGPYEIVHYFVGLSTDTKPTATAVLGDRFFESDTRLWYIYDGSTWSMLNEEFSLSLYGKCSSTMVASTTELVVPTLVGYGNDFFNNKFYIQILKNANSVGNAPEIQVRKITDYVSTSGTFTVDAFGANVEASDEIVVLHESLVAIGRDDSDNVYTSTNVGANADGSMLERLEWIQAALGSAAGQLRIAATTEDLNQAASSYDLFTGMTQPVILKALTIKMPTGAAGGALTSISIQTDDATPGVIISSTLGAVANLTSEADISWSGEMRIDVGTKIQLTIAGGAHGSEYIVKITATYMAVTAGGTLT